MTFQEVGLPIVISSEIIAADGSVLFPLRGCSFPRDFSVYCHVQGDEYDESPGISQKTV